MFLFTVQFSFLLWSSTILADTFVVGSDGISLTIRTVCPQSGSGSGYSAESGSSSTSGESGSGSGSSASGLEPESASGSGGVEEPCLTLQQLVPILPSIISQSTNVTLDLEPGNHSLHTLLSISNLTSLTVKSEGATLIVCSQEEARLEISSLLETNIYGITFIGCGQTTISHVDRLLLYDVTFQTSQNGSLILGHINYATVSEVMFLGTQSCCDDTAALNIFSSSLTLQNCTFSNNTGVALRSCNSSIDMQNVTPMLYDSQDQNNSLCFIYESTAVETTSTPETTQTTTTTRTTMSTATEATTSAATTEATTSAATIEATTSAATTEATTSAATTEATTSTTTNFVNTSKTELPTTSSETSTQLPELTTTFTENQISSTATTNEASNTETPGSRRSVAVAVTVPLLLLALIVVVSVVCVIVLYKRGALPCKRGFRLMRSSTDKDVYIPLT